MNVKKLLHQEPRYGSHATAAQILSKPARTRYQRLELTRT